MILDLNHFSFAVKWISVPFTLLFTTEASTWSCTWVTFLKLYSVLPHYVLMPLEESYEESVLWLELFLPLWANTQVTEALCWHTNSKVLLPLNKYSFGVFFKNFNISLLYCIHINPTFILKVTQYSRGFNNTFFFNFWVRLWVTFLSWEKSI